VIVSNDEACRRLRALLRLALATGIDVREIEVVMMRGGARVIAAALSARRDCIYSAELQKDEAVNFVEREQKP
jgi:hypothetical protein